MASRLAWACLAVALVLVVAGTALGLAAGTFPTQTAFSLAYVLAAGTVGGLVASRHPRNAIGWILCALVVWAGIESVARSSAEYLLAAGSEASGERAAWVVRWSFVPFAFVPPTFLLLLFPDGRLLSRRYRPIAWAAGAVIVFWVITTALDERPVPNFESVDNPFAIDAPALNLASDLAVPLMLLCILASAASVFARARRATAVERQQLKVLAFAGCFAVATLIAGALLSSRSGAGAWLFYVAVISLPIAIGVAILRYGLYEIDVVINRTLSTCR